MRPTFLEAARTGWLGPRVAYATCGPRRYATRPGFASVRIRVAGTGVGPRLTGFGVSGALADPKVDLFLAEGASSTLFATNDNWAEAGAAPIRQVQVNSRPLPERVEHAVLFRTCRWNIRSDARLDSGQMPAEA